jgi:hypothetical protein
MSFTERIRYKDHCGFLDKMTGNVQFYDQIYRSINQAIQQEANLELDKHDYFRVTPKHRRKRFKKHKSFRTLY